ncbi:hypothetical protein SANA_10480 [Gottschalkiaceae bacterium SANA]|nr:hypothetical protein SANA_10480 [Gottschalkiaceae bacterium SANA]
MTEEKRQEEFIRRITDQIHDQQRANQIKDEMRDHLETAVADYMEMDLSLEEAGAKARKQMGDPAALGYALEKSKKQKMTKLEGISYALLLLQSLVALRVIQRASVNFSWIEMGIVFLMVGVTLFFVVMTVGKQKQDYGMPLMVIRPNKGFSSLDQVTTGILLFCIGLMTMGVMASFLDGESISIPLMNWLFMVSIMLTTINGQRQGKAIYTEGIQFNRGKLLSWSEYKSYRVLVSHTKRGKVYQIKLYGGKIEPIIGVEMSQLSTVEALISECLTVN